MSIALIISELIKFHPSDFDFPAFPAPAFPAKRMRHRLGRFNSDEVSFLGCHALNFNLDFLTFRLRQWHFGIEPSLSSRSLPKISPRRCRLK